MNDEDIMLGETIQSALLEGMEFKNFKELADRLGLQYVATSTCSIDSIKKKMSRWMEWEQVAGTRRLRVTEVYSCPVQVGGRMGYADWVLPVVGLLLHNSSEKCSMEVSNNSPYADDIVELVITNRQLYEAIGLCNTKLWDKYYIERDWKDDLPESEVSEQCNESMRKVVLQNRKKCSQIKNDVKEVLEKRRLVRWYSSYTFRRGTAEILLANKSETAAMDDATNYALTELKLPNMGIVFKMNKYREWKELAFEYSTRVYGITQFKEVNHLVAMKANIQRFLITDKAKLLETRLKFNDVLIESLMESNRKEFKKATKLDVLEKLEKGYLNGVEIDDVSTAPFRLLYGFSIYPTFLSDAAKMHTLYRNDQSLESLYKVKTVNYRRR